VKFFTVTDSYFLIFTLLFLHGRGKEKPQVLRTSFGDCSAIGAGSLGSEFLTVVMLALVQKIRKLLSGQTRPSESEFQLLPSSAAGLYVRFFL
jgi:hypothetical protein